MHRSPQTEIENTIIIHIHRAQENPYTHSYDHLNQELNHQLLMLQEQNLPANYLIPSSSINYHSFHIKPTNLNLQIINFIACSLMLTPILLRDNCILLVFKLYDISCVMF